MRDRSPALSIAVPSDRSLTNFHEGACMAIQSRDPANDWPNQRVFDAPTDNGELHELLTVEDVATLLKVSRSWVYEHTRSRGTARTERLPYIKIGKYKRFDPRSVREFLLRRSKIA
jgi:predicted DNA-binding transcriptional regulator AlpA